LPARLWMIAEASLYQQLAREQELYVDPARCAPNFAAAYAWMCEQMALRVPTYGGHLPWWAWAVPPAGRQRPDLRARQPYHAGWPTGTRCVRLELAVPAHEVLLSDFDEWHAVLNRSPLVATEAEWDAFEALPESEGAAARRATWPRLFDLAAPPDTMWHAPNGETGAYVRVVQACFETVRLADVRGVTPFVARPPTRAW
jgi:Domain of unknown function (DUF3841)